jgi:ferric-dicitrate binding protein FerR (iron transport regulator)
MSLDEWLGIGLADEIVDDAIVWVAKLDGDTLSDEEKRAFFVWLDAAPEHQWAYEEISEAWSKLKGLQAVKDSLVRSEVVYLTRPVELADSSPLGTDTYSRLSWITLGLMLIGVVVGIVA